MSWPAKRVEGIYKVIVIREAVASIEHQRRDMIAACYSNPNWDGKENAEKRKDYLNDLNDHFNQAITEIYYPGTRKGQDVDWSNPFFAAHKREMERTREIFGLDADGKTAGELVEAEQRTNGQREFDQT